MILPNNPEIDVDDLMARVRADAARIRITGAVDDRRIDPRNADDRTLAHALDRHRKVTRFLDLAEKLNVPRTTIPRRIAAFKVFDPPIRAALKILNYAFKGQREFNAHLMRVNREMNYMHAIIGEGVARMTADLRSLDRYRTETFRDLKAAQQATEARLSGLEHSHHLTHVAADRALATIEALRAEVATLRERLNFAHARIDSGEATAGALSARLEQSPTQAQVRIAVLDALRDVERRIATGTEALLRNDALLRSELLTLRSAGAGAAAETAAAGPPNAAGPANNDSLHAALGDAFRGDRDAIGERLGAYLPALEAAAVVDADHPLLDIGSGRGEWLHLLAERGIPALGVELNAILVSQSVQAGLDVTPVDALAWLREREAGSLGAVTAFHVVEHLPFDRLYELLIEAQRTLIPGGLLILETPNPANIIVSSQTFYLDPTHLHPVPSALLQFLVESAGYSECTLQELHPPQTPTFPADDPIGAKLNTFFASAQDYAIVARTPRR